MQVENSSESLISYIKEIKNLPTLPVIAQKILGLFGDKKLSVENLKDVIEKDPAISAKILSVANSAFFGFQISTDFLSNAIVKIGFDNVKNIALGISLMMILDDGKRGNSFDYRKIFNHSIAVGFTARRISKNLKLDNSDDALLYGILHDLGYMVLNRCSQETYQEVLHALEDEIPILEAEHRVFQFTHADI